jgi:membrane associated rhomboid family serine protease
MFQHFDRSQLRITRVAMLLLFALIGVSLVYAMQEPFGKARMEHWLVPYGDAVWREGRVWTLITGPFIELRLVSLIFQGLMIWMMLPALERWWGPKRFALFVGLTAIAGTLAGTLLDFALGGRPVPSVGLDPTLFASAIAFGILYARQPIQFFGVLPMTGRQLMYGILAFLTLFVVLEAKWSEGIAFLAAIAVAVMLTSERWSPRLAWLRWKQRRARAHLDVLQGGLGSKPGKSAKNDKRWVN